MKCDDFIANYEACSAWSRLRAQVHVKRCPTCASTRDWLSQVRSQLATPTAITPFHRRVWERAAAGDVPEPVAQRIATPQLAVVGSLALAASLVVALVLSPPENDPKGPNEVVLKLPQRSSSTIVTRSLEPSPAEIAALETGLDQLEADLKRLSEEAARLETLRALGKLAAQYQPLDPGDST
jgi:hypothetical protein